MTTIQKRGILKPDRLIYVSWHVGEEHHRPWVDHFCRKVHGPSKDIGCALGRTDGERAGDPLKDVIGGVTDMVAVLTDAYLIANQNPRGNAKERELARFIELVPDPISDEGSRRAWLAPLESCTYRRFKFGDLSLADETHWLRRRKADGEVYPPPPGPTADREIWLLVEDIINAIEEDDDGRTRPKARSFWKSMKRWLTGRTNEGG
jgi:hypothetical protein